MKKGIAFIQIIFIYSFTFAHDFASVTIYNGGIITESHDFYGQQPFSAQIAFNDSAIIFAHGDSGSTPATLIIMNNSDTLRSGPIYHSPAYMLTVTDTGHYVLYYSSGLDDWEWHFDISYFSATDIETQESEIIRIIPNLSNGFFKVSGSEGIHLKEISIRDSNGTIVFISKNNQEIDLANFSSRVYFYSIIDEKNRIWRGKIIKQ